MPPLRLLLAFALAAFCPAACDADGGSGLGPLDVNPGPDAFGVDASPGPELDSQAGDGLQVAPRLAVDPPALDFEWLFVGSSATLPLTLTNTGTLSLTIEPPTLVFATTDYVDLPDAPAELFSIAPGDSAAVQVRFSPSALFPPRNDPIAFVRLVSNDPAHPSQDVPVFGRVTEATSPDLRVEPATLDLGAVADGGSTTGKVTLENHGNRELRVSAVYIEQASSPFSVLANPAFPPTLATPTGATIPPGGHQSVKVGFDSSWADLEPGPVTGTLVIASDDPHTPKRGVALAAEVAAHEPCPLAVVTPSPVVLGDVTVGCQAGARSIRLENGGPQTTRIKEVSLKPSCAALFPLSLVPSTPVDVPAGASVTFDVGFAPQVQGLASCLLTVRIAGCADQFLGLAGTGVLTSAVLETFEQYTAARLDLLLVVDGSASMSPVLDRLAEDLPALFSALSTFGVDAQIGLIGVSANPACPEAATLLSDPRIATTADGDDLAAAVAAMGLDPCVPTVGEAGLEAMRLALSAPRITDLGVPCGGPADCEPPYGCHDGRCGGPNRGFLRPEADLRVLFVSDEDDQSPYSVDLYLSFLEALKGPLDSGRVGVYALVGEPPAGCVANGVSASAGSRYLQAVEATGGATASVCSADPTGLLVTLGSTLTHVQSAFPLGAPPVPATLAVAVDGVPCLDGWWLDPTTNQVVFDPEGGCLPPPGSVVTVQYERKCQGS